MDKLNQLSFFGPYQILEKIGGGGFSEIFRVKKDGQFFALKKLLPHLKYDSAYRGVLETEALLLSRIGDPDHFPLLQDHGKLEEEQFLVLDLIDGLNLKEAIDRSFKTNRRAPPALAALITLEICKGLEKLHALPLLEEKPTVHGDLRPSNVMVTREGKVKMIDLGLKGGTFDYMPLERLHDRIVNFYSDIFGTGHVLYELLHGRLLFKGKTKMEAYFDMRDLIVTEEIFDSSLPPSLKKILVRCLNQDPAVRYSTVTELKNDLEDYLQQEKSTADSKVLSKWFLSLLSD